jgi:tetratricopeptide (TPR) repeat protein
MRLIRKFWHHDGVPNKSAYKRGETPKRYSGTEGGAEVLGLIADLLTQRRHAEALVMVDRALAEASDQYDLLFARASVLFSWWRYAEAYAILVSLEQSGSRNGAFYAKLGWTCFWLGRVDEASKWMREAVAHDPEDWSTHFGRGVVLRAQKRPAASKMEFERVLALKPNDPHALSNLVACDVELGHLDIAERNARDALARDRQNSSAMVDLGIVLCEQARYSDAVAEFERADAIGFESGDARDESVNYAICLLRAGRVRQANSVMEAKLRHFPSAALHAHYGLALLAAGRMREGWGQYEFRWLQDPMLSSRPKFNVPVWTGQELQGKTILLCSEQGYGDFFQFIRYAASVKALGASVLLKVREELRELAARAPGVDRVVPNDEPLPPFDFYINLLSIPRNFGTDLDSIPTEVPYLHTDPLRVARWQNLIRRDGPLNVGLVWAGSTTHVGDRFRSLSLRALAPLRKIKGVRFHSLQKGPAAAELITDRGFDPIVDLGPELATFADTAAAIDQLDLIISVDTSVVHLAGALAKPVWTLVAIPSDWRWLEEREDSPWYPTMRLFRQREPGAWDDVLGRLRTALEREVNNDDVKAAPTRFFFPQAIPEKPIVNAGWSERLDLCRVAETRAGIMMYMPEDLVTGQAIELYGECLQAQFEVLERLLKPGMTVLEVDAGIGAHSVPLASMLGNDGHLFLYEDDCYARQILRENLKANVISNATVMRRSLSGVRRDDSRSEAAPPLPGSVELQTETIDDLRLKRLDWLKIGERTDAAHVLQGACDTIRRLHPGVFIVVPGPLALLALGSVLKKFGYTSWRVETPLFNPANFNKRDVDVFEGRKSLALVASPGGSQPAIQGCERLA